MFLLHPLLYDLLADFLYTLKNVPPCVCIFKMTYLKVIFIW